MRQEIKVRGACGWLVLAAVLVGASIGGYRLSQSRRHRARLVHTEQLGDWTARVIRIGLWSEEKRDWIGRTRFEIEFVDPSGAVRRVRVHFRELAPVLEYTRRELRKRSTPDRPISDRRPRIHRRASSTERRRIWLSSPCPLRPTLQASGRVGPPPTPAL